MQRLQPTPAAHAAARRRYVRHPGYLGWLLWAVGTQVLLCNPVTTIAFAVVVRAPWGAVLVAKGSGSGLPR